MSGSDTKTLVLSSSFDEMSRIEPFVKELQEWTGFNEDDYSRILLTLSEAVTNAIVHGNQENSSKKVTIKSQVEEAQTLTISIEDEGEGFDPDSIPDPLKEENLLNEGGRGVYLIEQYADELQFTKKGTKLTIIFRFQQ